MEIMLGIFRTDWFYTLKNFNSWDVYPFENTIGKVRGCITELVEQAAARCLTINFLLDQVDFPLYMGSITCQELEIILRNPNWFDKTIFWEHGLEVNKETILIKYKTYHNVGQNS